jgi:hypothetical protein
MSFLFAILALIADPRDLSKVPGLSLRTRSGVVTVTRSAASGRRAEV